VAPAGFYNLLQSGARLFNSTADERFLSFGELAKNGLGCRFGFRSAAYTDLDARELIGLECFEDRADATMATIASAHTGAHFSERHVDIVEHKNDLRRLDVTLLEQLMQHTARAIHTCLRL
jgi:hypothetical protein